MPIAAPTGSLLLPPGPDDLALLAPGAGLGHLVRATGLALRLADLGIPVRVLTNSRFGPGLARLVPVPVETFRPGAWSREIGARLAAFPPRLTVLDTFPWGLRGEWCQAPPPGTARALLARTVDAEAYLASLPDRPAPLEFSVTLAIEPLPDAWEGCLAHPGPPPTCLPGRIRFPGEALAPAPDPALSARLEQPGSVLVVHAGSPEELAHLRTLAASRAAGPEAIVVVTPFADRVPGSVEAFPAGPLFARAGTVVTGGGYNSVAEASVLPPGRHLALAFERRYDDQAFRLAGANPDIDGGPVAAHRLAEAWEAARPGGLGRSRRRAPPPDPDTPLDPGSQALQ